MLSFVLKVRVKRLVQCNAMVIERYANKHSPKAWNLMYHIWRSHFNMIFQKIINLCSSWNITNNTKVIQSKICIKHVWREGWYFLNYTKRPSSKNT